MRCLQPLQQFPRSPGSRRMSSIIGIEERLGLAGAGSGMAMAARMAMVMVNLPEGCSPAWREVLGEE